MPDGYNDVFGGQNVSPAQLNYKRYTIGANLSLVWPFQATDDTPDILTHKIDIAATVAGLTVFLPAADVASVGQDTLIRNVGSIIFAVASAEGTILVAPEPGLQWFLWISDNTTPDGVWEASLFGASSSSANAGSLAGAGLRANVTKLDQNLVTLPLLGNYTLTQGDRARVIRNDGGSVLYTFNPAASLGNGWFAYFINAGTGSMTLDPSGAETIDTSATKVIAPGESLAVFSDGTELFTLGYGRSLVNSVSSTNIVTSGGTTLLSSPQITAQVQDWTGTLSSNAILDYGGAVGYWFVQNATTGAFTTTARTNALDPGVVVPQGTFSILRSNGTNMKVAFTATTGTVTQVNTTPGQLIGGPITTTGTLGLADTTVAPGDYGDYSAVGTTITAHYPMFTVDQKGRLTLAGETVLGNGAFINFPVDAGNNFRIPSIMGGSSTGDIKASIAAAIPGWVLSVGTIGRTGSGATRLADDSTKDLFFMVWAQINAANAPMFASGTTTPVVPRGASADADWTAGRHIQLPDMRGVTVFGLTNMGGTTDRANLATGFGASTTVMANQGGLQTTQVRHYGYVDVTGGITSGGTTGALTAHVWGGTSGVQGGSWYGGIVGSGDVLHGDHVHNIDIWGDAVGTLGIYGNVSAAGSIRNDGNNLTDIIRTVAPGVMMNVFLKL